MKASLAQTFGEFASRLSHGSVPRQVREAAWWHVVDTIGVCVAAADPLEDSGRAANKLAERWRTRTGATVFGVGARCQSDKTALINGALAQAASPIRPSSAVTPAVLAVAEETNLAVEDAITAVAVGYEVMIRLGFVADTTFLERDYHTSSLLGAFGTVCAVGNLLRLDPSQIADALGIAGSFASGIQEATRADTSNILHGGWNAHNGIIALELATAGITNPSSVFEEQRGLSHHLTPIKGDLDRKKTEEGLGARWYVSQTAYKPYPSCQLLHAFIDAAKALLGELKRDSVSVNAINCVTASLPEPGLTLVNDPIEWKRGPEHPHEARFSLPYALAFVLLHEDANIEALRAKRLSDPNVRRLAALVRCGKDQFDYPTHNSALLEIVAQGKIYKIRIPFDLGSAGVSLSEGDVLGTFARNSGWLLGEDAREVGASLISLSEGETVRTISQRIQQPTVTFSSLATRGMGQC